MEATTQCNRTLVAPRPRWWIRTLTMHPIWFPMVLCAIQMETLGSPCSAKAWSLTRRKMAITITNSRLPCSATDLSILTCPARCSAQVVTMASKTYHQGTLILEDLQLICILIRAQQVCTQYHMTTVWLFLEIRWAIDSKLRLVLAKICRLSKILELSDRKVVRTIQAIWRQIVKLITPRETWKRLEGVWLCSRNGCRIAATDRPKTPL